MKFIYVIPFFFLLVTSCKKGKADFVLAGTITDATFSQALSGATVELYEVKAGSSNEQYVGSCTLGSDGKYQFTFPRDKMEKYILRVSKTGYFSLEEVIYFSSLTVSQENIRNYSTTAKSWVKLTFHNLNPLPSDHLTFIKQSGKENCTECCVASEQNYYGALDTSIYCINDGNTYYSYMYWVAGTSDQGVKSTTTIAFDTTEIILSY